MANLPAPPFRDQKTGRDIRSQAESQKLQRRSNGCVLPHRPRTREATDSLAGGSAILWHSSAPRRSPPVQSWRAPPPRKLGRETRIVEIAPGMTWLVGAAARESLA